VKLLFETVDQLERTMDYARDRHTVLAKNLSNIDTPGYKALDLVAEDPSTPSVESGSLATTHAGHIAAAVETREASSGQIVADANAETGADGNGVSLERELAKIDANRVRYNASVELVSRKLALLRYTASDGQA
jgi:flagellar basal-body rod protein FlgB